MKNRTWKTNLRFFLSALFGSISMLLAGSGSMANLFAAVESKELLRFDFNDKDHLGTQTGPLPLGTVEGNAQVSADFPGALNFGSTGYVVVPNFKNPTGAFSIETRFRLNEYALQNTRFITDLVNTSQWDNVITHGFAQRIGGGNIYSPLPLSAYSSREDYLADIDWYNDGPDASLSKCIGEFVIAIKGNPGPWSVVVTDRCIERKTWVHMVSVYDGVNMHIYLNGLYATDTLRVLNKGKIPNLNPYSDIFIGARTSGNWDARHLDGDIDFIRIVDSAMSAREIREHYSRTVTSPKSDTLCHGSILPLYPNPGQAVDIETQFRCRLVAEGACTQPGFNPTLLPTDSIEIEIARDFDFKQILVRMVVKDLTFKLDPTKYWAISNFKGGAYWRVRIKHADIQKSLSKRAAIAVSEWSLSRPVVVDLHGSPVGIKTSPITLKPKSSRFLLLPGQNLNLEAKGSLKPRLWSLDGVAYNPNWVFEKNNRWTAVVPNGVKSQVMILSWEPGD